MISNDDYPPPKYEDAVRDSSNSDPATMAASSQPETVAAASAATTTTATVSGSESTAGATPFRVSLISSTTPVFGPNPIETDCPYCQAHIVTSVKRIAGALPWIIMGICFLLGFFLLIPWCLCCVPFCMDNCRDVVHSCPCCKRIIGQFTRV